MKSAPQRPIFVSVNIKQKYMKLILRLGLILFTGFISISTASAQLYGTADTNAPELRVPTSVKPAFDYWMRDTWATLGPDGYYYITGTTSTPDRYFPGQRHCWDWNDGLYPIMFLCAGQPLRLERLHFDANGILSRRCFSCIPN